MEMSGSIMAGDAMEYSVWRLKNLPGTSPLTVPSVYRPKGVDQPIYSGTYVHSAARQREK